MLASLTERWVHDDAIESFLAQFDKGEATGGILREERILVAFLLTQSGRKLLQGSLQTLRNFLEELILMMTKLTAILIGCHNLSTAFFRIKDFEITVLVHLAPVLAQIFNVVADFLLHLKEQASLAHKLHLVPDGGEQTLHRLVQLVHQALEQTLVARHSLCQNQIALADERTLTGRNAHLAIATLGTKPEAKRSKLKGTRVNLATEYVILKNQSWHFAMERFPGVYLAIRYQQLRMIVPCIHIDILIHLVEIEAKVHGATCRIERENLGRLLDGTFLDGLVWTPHHVVTFLLTYSALSFGHLVPDSAKRVVGKESDDVLRRKELVAHSHLTTVAWLVAFLAHLATLLQRVVVLEHPAKSLILHPEVDSNAILLVIPLAELCVVDEVEQF